MVKYTDSKIVFQEVPDEISLAISISGCKGMCEGCHSPWLRGDIGKELTWLELKSLIDKSSGISCVCLMGGDHDIIYLQSLFYEIKKNYPNTKTAWYSGLKKLEDTSIMKYLDYLKLGPYMKELGPLNSPTTNQRFYEVVHTEAPSTVLVDITHKFLGNEISST